MCAVPDVFYVLIHECLPNELIGNTNIRQLLA